MRFTDAHTTAASADLSDRLTRLRWRISCLAFKEAAGRFEALRRAGEARRLRAKYDPNQPRDELGRWTDAGGSNEFSSARRTAPIRQFAKWSAKQFISTFCQARINREFPKEFEDLSIQDIIDIARGGDARARKCLKLLNRRDYRK